MKRFTVLIIVVLALIVGAGIGWLIRGTAAVSPSSVSNQTATTTPLTPTSCTAPGLTASIAASTGGAAAGSRYYDIKVSNSSDNTCTINGYPGVSLTDLSGNMVGSAADKDTSKAAVQISLAPQATAVATIRVAVSDAYPAGTCKEGVTTVKIYPPNDTGYLSVPTDSITTWCPGFTTTAFVKG